MMGFEGFSSWSLDILCGQSVSINPFRHFVLDCIGPVGESGRFKYPFVITDLNTRFPMPYALTNITAKKICDCLIDFFSIFSMPTVIHCDRGTNFTSSLTQLLLQRLGCAPRFNSSYHPQSSGLVERTNATLKNIISKLAASFPRSWETILPFACGVYVRQQTRS
jgi:transposase InsO family protein